MVWPCAADCFYTTQHSPTLGFWGFLFRRKGLSLALLVDVTRGIVRKEQQRFLLVYTGPKDRHKSAPVMKQMTRRSFKLPKAQAQKQVACNVGVVNPKPGCTLSTLQPASRATSDAADVGWILEKKPT
eukprot:150958-Amphidinium_carterae.1